MNFKNIVTSVVVAALVSVAAIFAFYPSETYTQYVPASTENVAAATASGGVHQAIEQWVNGLMPGDQNEFWKSGTIEAGRNQASFQNKTGRTVYFNPSNASIGWTTGTASTTFAFYIATSTGASISNDFATPAGNLLLSGAYAATTTQAQFYAGTTTSNGVNGAVTVPAGSYVNILVRSFMGGLCDGSVCETSTSTNRGITRFLWTIKGRYQP